MPTSRAPELFLRCAEAITAGVLITRESSRDKEFAAQEWLKARLDDSGFEYKQSRRNTYPDFLVEDPLEGCEVKSLAYPLRELLNRAVRATGSYHRK